MVNEKIYLKKGKGDQEKLNKEENDYLGNGKITEKIIAGNVKVEL